MDVELILPDICDALVARWSLVVPEAGLTVNDVFDGPQAKYAGSKGVAIGATVEDTRGTFEFPAADLGGGQGERDTLPCLIWAGAGAGPFKPLRDTVKAVFRVLARELARDRTLGGLVHTCWITDGEMEQLQIPATPQQAGGPLVTSELRLLLTRF